MARFPTPRRGEIYQLSFRGRTHDILVEGVSGGVVSFVILGAGGQYHMGAYEFHSNAYYVEHRIQRLRRACERYGLGETDQWLKKEILE